MPAINVARTDTFETQRVKINEIGSQVFAITQGGSDLATGNLRLGDGTRTAPSLAFTSDTSLGIFKSGASEFSYVASSKKLSTLSSQGVYSYRNFYVQKNVLNPSEVSLISSGSNYDPGTYSDILLTGGSGEFATADITVTAYTGTITNIGKNYNVGTYTSIPLVGGNGSGAISTFNVQGIQGFISQAGSLYKPGTYANVPITGGSGSNAEALIEITGESNIVGNITNAGTGYVQNSYTVVSLYNSPTQTFVLTSVANPGTPPPNNVYSIGGNVQQQLTLTIGNTYRFDISDSSLQGHPLIFETTSGGSLSVDDYVTVSSGNIGQAGAFIDLIIKPSATVGTIRYNCSAHNGMGADINIVTGAAGSYGSFATANITVDATGIVTDFSIFGNGLDYKSGDVLIVSPLDVGGTGSGFEFTISSIDYTGVVSAFSITNEGSGYLIDDVLSASDSDLGGAGGSGFQFTVNNNPRSIAADFSFTQKGTGYQLNDVLTLPQTISGVSANIPGEVTNVSSTASTATPVITVASTTNISVGMDVLGDRENDIGELALGTTVQSVDSATQITLSANPIADGSVTLSFRSPGDLTTVTLPSVTGIVSGSIISVASGVASLDANTTVSSIDANTNQIVLSQQSILPGSAVLEFVPPYGDPTVDDFEFTINALGPVESYNITNTGNGYSIGDQLSVSASDLAQPTTIAVTNKNISKVTFSNTLPDSTFSVGDILKRKDGTITVILQPSTPPAVTQSTISGIATTLSDSSAVITVASTTGITAGMIVSAEAGSTGDISPGTLVQSVDSATQITLDQNARTSGAATLSFTSDESGNFIGVASTSSGSGTGATFDVVRNADGTLASVAINNGGYFYTTSDTITIAGNLIGGTSPTHDITFDVDSIFDAPLVTVRKVTSSGGNITSILVDYDDISTGSFLLVSGTTSPEYEVATSSASPIYRYFLNTGSGETLTPDLTLYVGNTYTFDLSDSSNTGHVFSLSKYRDGIWGPSYIQGITSTVLTTSKDLTVADSTGILPGMEVSSTSGVGQLLSGTTVEAVNGNTITLSSEPVSSGAVVLEFRGVEYTDNVTRTQTSLSLKVTEATPNLYYYCATSDSSHSDEGGEDNEEALLTIDPNNPKTFGSGFQLSVLGLTSQDLVVAEVNTGNFTAVKLISDNAQIDTVVVDTSLTSPTISGTTLSIETITSSSLIINSGNTSISGNLSIGDNVQITSSTGKITTSGELKTTSNLNVNDYINITDNVISTTSGNDLVLTPYSGRVAKVNTNTALIIPSGNSAERPTGGIVANGAIRFNTDSGQYEGYNASTTSWASLGGVRDLDGNTYIAAEASVGANDNTLYFYNDGNNTVSVTPNYLQFVSVKKIRSINTTAPAYTDYATNTQVTIGDYLKYRNNIYEVTQTGQTGTSGNEPTHTSGAVSNGTAELTWYSTAVAPITFEETEEVRIDPLGFTDLVVNAELRFSNNVISTDLNDLIVRPNTGKKVTIDTNTSLVLPVGDTNQRGVAAQGSVRFNTTNSTYEGYDGTNWGSLGGVKDVDQNTYIIPELSAGSDENILYFYNNGTNTMRLSESALDFTNIDSITSQNNNLDIEAQTVTFNSLAATIDTSGTSTFIHTTKDNLDLGLAVGINVDPLLRLDTNGDIYVNKAFGTGSFDGLKLINSSFDSFELLDLRIDTQDIQLIKGGTNAGAAVLYDPTVDTGSRVTVSVHNQTTGDKEMIEYHVTDKGSDIFHTDISNLNTGVNQVSSVFDFDAQNKVRVTFTLTDLTIGDVVNITVVTNTFKK